MILNLIQSFVEFKATYCDVQMHQRFLIHSLYEHVCMCVRKRVMFKRVHCVCLSTYCPLVQTTIHKQFAVLVHVCLKRSGTVLCL